MYNNKYDQAGPAVVTAVPYQPQQYQQYNYASPPPANYYNAYQAQNPQYGNNNNNKPFIASPKPGGDKNRVYAFAGLCCILFIIILIVVVVQATKSGDCTTVTLGQEIRDGSNYVGVVFTGCPSADGRDAFLAAAATLSSIIAVNQITFDPATADIQEFDAQEICGFLGSFTVTAPTLDHLVVIAETVEIDGVNGVLAQAGPCAFDDEDSFFPLIAGMQFDNADIDALEADGTLEFTVLHEMSHTLGLGTLFSAFQQGGGLAANAGATLLQDEIFTQANNAAGFVTNLNNVPRFEGDAARAEFSTLTGNNEASVPIEDGRINGQFQFFRPDVIEGDGRGSIDGHWKIETFGNELMTFSINPNDNAHPLSRVSVASFQDLGYIVNLNAADAFSLPAGKEGKSALRGDGSDHILKGDIATTFIKGVDKIPTVTEKLLASPKTKYKI